jgi:ATP-dependent protease ClpP protease subunit
MSVKKTVYIRFFAAVNSASINTLISTIDQKLKEGTERFVILISSSGGTVFHGLSAYNYLVGVPAEIITHNFGSVDSIACVLFCAGSKRYSVPHARFLLHGVAMSFPQGGSLEEKQLEERLKGLKLDIENIARIIAAATNKSKDEIVQAMLDRTTLNPDQAKEFGLVHEIKTSLFEAGGDWIAIDQPQ